MKNNKIYSEFYGCMGLIDGNDDRMDAFIDLLSKFRESFVEPDNSTHHVTAKRKLFGNHFQSDLPENVTVRPPRQVSNKGSGAGGRRLKSVREQAIEQSKKPLRLCRKCNRKTNHDSRNCDKFTDDGNL
ncbi:hypothetical protein CASFOL_026194 [Castilleja foliolosa]|uniref:Uncharacterized protein n=1 Tax=Castilleja foliolosa TaxID=1961234 RepID=A0ABD3CMR2_9LAMI